MKKTGFLMALAVVASLVFSATAQDSSWKKARTLSGIAYDSGDAVCGWVDIKCGKAGKGNTAKVSGKITMLGSKAITLGAKTVQVASTVKVSFPIAGSTPLNVTITGDSFSGSQEDGATDPIRIETGTSKGDLANTSDPSVTAEYDSDNFKMPDGWDILDEALPDGEVFTVTSKGKWKFNKAAKIKFKKVKDDGLVSYELVGTDVDDDDDDEDEDGKKKKKKRKRRTNLSGLKLTYNAKTGTFKGTFRVYATNEFSTEKKPKLKKYTAKVAGMIVDGYGIGTAAVSKLGLQMSIVIE